MDNPNKLKLIEKDVGLQQFHRFQISSYLRKLLEIDQNTLFDVYVMNSKCIVLDIKRNG